MAEVKSYHGHVQLQSDADVTSCEFGSHYQKSAAKYPYYCNLTLRYKSFQGWPKHKSQKPYNLALAGFYFPGIEDCTRCFHCGIGLKNWLPGDEPFVEHARWSPQCAYIRQKKGDAFADNIQQNFPREYPDDEIQEDVTPDTTVTDFNDIIRRVLERPCGVSITEIFTKRIAVAAISRVLGNHGWEENAVTTAELANEAIQIQESQEWDSTQGESVQDGSEIPTESDEPEDIDVPDCPCAESVGNGDSNIRDPVGESLLAENRRLKSQLLCKKCRSKEVSAVVLPCGHYVYCADCAASLSRCVLCGNMVDTFIKVYV